MARNLKYPFGVDGCKSNTLNTRIPEIFLNQGKNILLCSRSNIVYYPWAITIKSCSTLSSASVGYDQVALVT